MQLIMRLANKVLLNVDSLSRGVHNSETSQVLLADKSLQTFSSAKKHIQLW